MASEGMVFPREWLKRIAQTLKDFPLTDRPLPLRRDLVCGQENIKKRENKTKMRERGVATSSFRTLMS